MYTSYIFIPVFKNGKHINTEEYNIEISSVESIGSITERGYNIEAISDWPEDYYCTLHDLSKKHSNAFNRKNHIESTTLEQHNSYRCNLREMSFVPAFLYR